MSTKDISRSSLEGGRYGYNKWERRESNRVNRGKVKAYLHQVVADCEHWYEKAVPERMPVHKGFTDKLQPAYRWLASNCGRPWSEVYSELTEKFDTRGLSSWHIVNQHMLAEVSGAGTEFDGRLYSYYGGESAQRFFIDENDILRDRGCRHYTRRKKKDKSGPNYYAVQNRMGQKRVVEYCGVLHWATPTAKDWCACPYKWNIKKCSVKEHDVIKSPPSDWVLRNYAEKKESVPDCMYKYTYIHYDFTAHKIGHPLNSESLAWWDTIAPHVKKFFIVTV